MFSCGLPKNLKDLANKLQVEHSYRYFELAIPFHSLVNMVDFLENTLERIKNSRTLT